MSVITRPSTGRTFGTSISLELDIEKIVIKGFEHVDTAIIGSLIEGALSHLFAEEGVPSLLYRNGQIDSLDGGTFTICKNNSSRDIGAQIAHAIYRSFII